jgi:hypothetical protein
MKERLWCERNKKEQRKESVVLQNSAHFPTLMMEAVCFPKHWYQTMKLHGITSKKAVSSNLLFLHEGNEAYI